MPAAAVVAEPRSGSLRGRGRLCRRWRLAPAAIALIALFTAACEVRRAPAPESTRQLQVAEIRRLVDRPALSPAAWAPDGRALAYSSDHRLWVYTFDRGEQDIAPAEVATALSWSRSLNLLALIDRGAVWTLRPDGTDRRPIALPGPAVALAWAPGGDRLAVVLHRMVEGQTRFELWLVSRDGGFRRMVTRAPAGRAIRDLQWFADSLYLLYGLSTAPASVMTEVWRVRISYPDRQQIPLPVPAAALRLAPSGRYLAVVSGEQIADGVGQVVLSRLDGSGRFAVTPQAGRYTGLAWSPQGDKVVFAQVTNDADAELWMADADGSGRLRLYSYSMEYTDRDVGVAFAWAPDGRRLSFGTNTGGFMGPIWLLTLQRR